MLTCILATDQMGTLGNSHNSSGLPWPRNTDDMNWVKNHTDGKNVIVGRKTRDILPDSVVDRFGTVYVLSNSPTDRSENSFHITLDKCISMAEFREETFVIGGKSVYEALIPHSNRILHTTIPGIWQGDSFIQLPNEFNIMSVIDTPSGAKFAELYRL